MASRAVMVSLLALAVWGCSDDGAADDSSVSSEAATIDAQADELDAESAVVETTLPEASLDIESTTSDGSTVTYSITCTADSAAIEGDVALDEFLACERLGSPAVQTRLVEGPTASDGCDDASGGPQTATIRGNLDGQSVDAAFDRSNDCSAADWDILMAEVLPTAS